MDRTPIYTELQQKLIDPEANNWGPSAPPEFAEDLPEDNDQSQTPAEESKNSRKTSTGRGGKRRHRAED